MYSLREVQAILKVGYRTLRRAIDGGHLRAERLFGHERKLTVTRADLEAYLAKRGGSQSCQASAPTEPDDPE